MDSSNKNIYSGKIELHPASPSSLALVSAIEPILIRYFGIDPRQAHIEFTNKEFLQRLGDVRKELASERFISIALSLLNEYGFFADDNLIDGLRLRAVAPFSHRLEAAAPAYFIHRDTWYANPQSQTNWWIPIYDTKNDDGFSIYPAYFKTAVKNNSEDFDYSHFKKTVGWQCPGATADAFPRLLEDIDRSKAIKIGGRRASLTRFSGAHLHGTHLTEGSQTRFSIDFRTVTIADHKQGIGAPNVDNSSRGSTIDDFFQTG